RRRDVAVGDALGEEALGDRHAGRPRRRDGRVADLAELAGDLVGEHFPQAEPEEVRRVAAVRPRHDVASGAGRATWTPVTARAAVGEPCADREHGVDVSHTVVHGRALQLGPGELALEELAPAP